jgi:predicted dehydrogenase
MMTERHEVTNRLMGEFIRDPEIFGDWRVGTAARPALVLESVHFLKKWVAGRPLARPWWWFDPAISGEAIADVGTHLADLAIGFLSTEGALDYRTDIHVLDAERWPLVLSEEQFRLVTLLPGYPPELAERVVEDQLYYAGNNTATFTIRGVHVMMAASWEFDSPQGGGDTHNAIAHGMRTSISIRQARGKHPELSIAAVEPADHTDCVRAAQGRCAALQSRYPGLAVDDRGTDVRLLIPESLRTSHESHFAEVIDEYARYFASPRAVPSWERPNALAKYFITTKSVELARAKRPRL